MASLALAFDILARDNASRTFNNVGDAADDAGRKGAKFGKALGAGLLVAGAAALAFGKSSVSAFVDAQQSSLALDEALRKFPKTNDVTRASFDDLNASLAKKTKFDDDATASGQAVLAQFKLTGTQIQELTPLLQDYAAKTGRDLPGAAEVLGKAILGNGKALKEIGIKFKDTGTAAGNLEQLTGGLRTQLGGFAEQQGKTAAGQADILKNRFGEVQEKVGSKLVPVLTDLANKLVSVIDFIDRNSAVIVPLVVVLGTFAAAIVTITTAAKTYTAVQAALNFVMAANPIGLVVIGLGLLIAAIVLAYQKSETFRGIVISVFKAVAGGVLGAIDGILGAFEGLFGVLGKLPGKAGAPFRALEGAVGAARGAVQGLQASIDAIQSKTVTIHVRTIQEVIAVAAENKASKNTRAHGGPVSAGASYLIGERGPEVVTFGADGFVTPNDKIGGRGGTTVNVYPQHANLDPHDLANIMRRTELLYG